MAQIPVTYPLEKAHQKFLVWWQVVTLHLLHMQAWARRVWAAMINETAYHARRPLLSDDSLICQSSLAIALGGSDKAIIVQKLHEWIETNRSKNNWKNKINGVWGTHNSYEDWRKEHFGWLSDDAIGRHVRALEKTGVIRTHAMKGSREKWYTIEYGRLNALLKDTKIAAALNLHPAKTQKKRADVNEDHANSHDDSSSKTNKKTKAVTQETITPPHIPDAVRLEPLTSTEQSADSDSHASGEAHQPGQSKKMGGSDFADPIPSSAPPLSQIDQAAANIWAMAHMQLSEADELFRRWLKEASLRSYRCVDGIATYAVTVSSAQAKDMLQRRYYRNVERVFKGLQNTPVKIEFEVMT